jgi:uncharacterized membrane protein
MLPEQTIDERVVHRLWLAGALPRDGYHPALRLARDQAFWRRWGERMVLGLAAAHLLAGVLFFFAFNWQDLGPFAKLGVLQGAVLAAALASRLPLLPEFVRETLLIVATVLVGVLFAVFGQIYQTGANAWQLFAAWAGLTLPWVLSGRSAGHWLMWLVVVETAVATYLDSIHLLQSHRALALTVLLLSLPAVTLLVGRETLLGRFDWLAPRWARLVPLSLALGMLFWGAEAAVVDEAAPWAVLPFLAALTIAAGAYGRWRPDLGAVALVVLLGCGLLSTALGRWIWEQEGRSHGDGFGLFLLTGLEIAVVFGAGSWLLRRIHRSWSGDAS